MTRTRTYGKFVYLPLDGQRAVWSIEAHPDTAIRLKRVFPRMNQERTGALKIVDTPGVARDLEWFMSRWPMQPFDQISADRLAARAQQHCAMEEVVDEILSGERVSTGSREPALPARPHQLVVPQMVTATGRLLLADDLGMGKTFSSLLKLCDSDALPALVVLPPHLARQWQREAHRFVPWLTTHLVRSRKPYRVPAADVLIISYPMLFSWGDYLAGKIRTVIWDEMQELRTGEGTNKYTASAMIADKALFRLGATATPVYNYGPEIFNVISVLDQDALGSRAEFMREWCQGSYGPKARVADPGALGLYLRDQGLMLRRTLDDIGQGRCDDAKPLRIEQYVDTDVEEIDRISEDMVAMARKVLDKAIDRLDRFKAAGELDLRLRHATGVAKAPYVAEFVKLLLESEQRLVLFGWFRDVYGIWQHRLAPYNPVMHTGSETPAEKDRSLERFKHGDSRVLLMSLRSGAGVDGLQHAANVCVFGELDWSPAVHAQDIGRLDREGQRHRVIAYFMISEEGSDPPMAEVLDIKRQQAEPIMDPGAQLFEVRDDAGLRRVQSLAEQVIRRSKAARVIR